MGNICLGKSPQFLRGFILKKIKIIYHISMKKFLMQTLELEDYEILPVELSGGSRPRITLLNKNNHKFFLKLYTKTPRELWVELFASKLWDRLQGFTPVQDVTLKKIPDSILQSIKSTLWNNPVGLKPLGVLIDNAFPVDFEIKYGHRVVGKNPRDTISMKEVYDSICRNYAFAWLHESLLQWYSDMIIFDALIGNMDRHLENWWVLEDSIFQSSQMTLMPKHNLDKSVRFTPLFDHGSAALFELSEEKVREYLKNLSLFQSSYIQWWKYSLITADNWEPMNIFDTIQYQIKNSAWKKYLKKSIQAISLLTLLDMAEVIFKMPEDRVDENENREAIEYSRDRKELLLQSLYLRQQILRKLL
jgi:hypothetical protein